MKKNLVLSSIGAACLVLMSACNSELDLDKELKFSTLTVEEQKQKIEDNGVELVDNMELLMETDAMKAFVAMGKLGGANPFAVPAMSFVKGVEANDVEAISTLDKQLRVALVDSEVWGTYEYNFTTKKMEKKGALVDKIVIKCPSTESGSTNNVEITLNYTKSTVVISGSSEPWPKLITLVMKIDGSTVLSGKFEGSYKEDGTPNRLKQTLDIDNFSWEAKFDNDNNEEDGASISLKKGLKTLFRSEAVINGTLSQDALKAAVDSLNSNGTQDAVQAFALYFQVMDLAVKGGMKDVDAFTIGMRALEDNTYATEKEAYDARVAVINQNLICYAFFADDNRKFADVEFYAKEETTVNPYGYFDYNTYQWMPVTTTTYSLQPRFVLSDGSKKSIEEYMESGFEALQQELETFQLKYFPQN